MIPKPTIEGKLIQKDESIKKNLKREKESRTLADALKDKGNEYYIYKSILAV